ncbi:hypothetical protein IV203_005989 [Nitzschia inconspicua]|uniref:Uncharacterized protein n=1 Tax=Nitzschia inconspicua TaxID=303405 RepID=A0A9K3KPT4_9STRA|nr:hypothetical protein IV203_005989 [Nitzschia inconspicua]
MFQDDTLVNPLSNANNFLTPNMVVDGSSGVQKVTVTFTVDEMNILSSPIISSAESRSIVSFSTRLSIRDPNIPSNTAASLDTSIIFELMTAGKVGITGLLEEQQDKYGLNVYECDKDNNRLPVVQPKSQQDLFRLCIEPDEIARNDAVKMYGISSLTIEDGQNIQSVLKDGSVQNSATTEYSCTLDGKLCYIETLVDNSFFVKDQTVHATGIAGLQYVRDNDRRGLMEAPIHVRRKTRTAGGPAGQKTFDLAFAVKPSTTAYEARAFLCDQRQKELTESEIVPMRHGERASVCVSPTQDAKNRGIFIRDIRSFVFSKNGKEQFLEKPRQITENVNKTSVDQPTDITSNICTAGEPICSFSIALADGFFNGNGEPVNGTGEVELQFGSGKTTWTRRMLVALTIDTASDRSLEDSDPDFAGVASVSLTIPIDPTSTAPSVAWASQSLNFWTSMPTYGKVLIVLGVLTGFVVFLAGVWCFIYGIDSFHFPSFKQEDNSMYDYDHKNHGAEYVDPEDPPTDTLEALKGEERAQSLIVKPLDESPGRNTNDSVTTKSMSSHSRGDMIHAKARGRSRSPTKGRVRSLSPTKAIKGKSFQSRSFDGRNDSRQSERREKGRSCSKERLGSNPPTLRSRQNSTEAFFDLGINSAKHTKNKNPDKPASIDNLLGWFGKTENKDRSSIQTKTRARSLSPGRVIKSSNTLKASSIHGRIAPAGESKKPKARKKNKAGGKSLKSVTSQGTPSTTFSAQSTKLSTFHGTRSMSPKQTSSTKSRINSITDQKSATSSGHSRTKTVKTKTITKASSKNDTIQSSNHSVGSCSSISEVSVNSRDGSRMKGRKKDILPTNSSHSVQSFSSSGGSFCSMSSNDLEIGGDTPGIKRGKRPSGKGAKTKKTAQMHNSYEIVNRLD